MKPASFTRRSHHAGAAVAVSVLLLAVSSCSENGRERAYTTPRSLCGTTVDSEELSKFLSPGEKVATKKTVDSSTATRCAVSVDGKRIVYTAQEWWNDMTVFEFAQGMTLDELDHQTDDGHFAYSGNQAFGKTQDCRNGKDQVLYTAIQATGSKHQDPAAMKKLINAYTRAVERSDACR
ncbi:hypothetical protein SAMN05428944_2385 [Streptomyces sp. 1222.5]|uniref:hypothetical protein n=1 Tax=unclassified Streptomyces TaxID=2593676 RepID=UPI000898A654|nr:MULTISPECIES: hypothetical protein [unclassified Streptomyces]PKW10427.1 hypothetical protein BX260_5709 [Streptomyces sp. 5112.2]SEC06413.1 hypothetical protein SAMN05428944_2385 [Streptomyces sp. 1222.5]